MCCSCQSLANMRVEYQTSCKTTTSPTLYVEFSPPAALVTVKMSVDAWLGYWKTSLSESSFPEEPIRELERLLSVAHGLHNSYDASASGSIGIFHEDHTVPSQPS
jgi:hypothetical protein